MIEGGKQQLWESNVFGQRGTGMAAGDVLAATRCDFGALAGADTLVVFVACSCFHTVVLTSDGGVIAFGSNPHGQLGTVNNNAQPTDAAHFGGAPIAAVTCGHNHTLAITRGEGRLYWGNVREWRHWPRAHGRRRDAAARG